MLPAREALRPSDYLNATSIQARYPVIQAGTIFKERLDALEGLLYVYIVLGSDPLSHSFFGKKLHILAEKRARLKLGLIGFVFLAKLK